MPRYRTSAMEVSCEGCAGCCIDWRPVAPSSLNHERRGGRQPIDDAYNFVPLSGDEVRAFLDAGLGDAMTPRLWRTDDAEDAVAIDGTPVAAVEGCPAFFVGLRRTPKPVAPFGLDARWLDACTFLDPETLQCRIYGDDLYPDDCAEYPGHNIALDVESECERVETAYGEAGERLLDDDPPSEMRRLLLGGQALGGTVFVHPDPDRLTGTVARLEAGELTAADRAEFVGVAVGSHPGSTEVDEVRAERAKRRALEADSWGGRAAAEWTAFASALGDRTANAPTGEAVEEFRGAPWTPGW